MLLPLVCYGGGNMAGKLVEWYMARGDSICYASSLSCGYVEKS